MPRKTEIIDTFYRGLTADGEIVKESKFLKAVERPMRHHPNGTIETRDLVGYYTPWTPVKESPRAIQRAANDRAKRYGTDQPEPTKEDTK